MVRVATQTTHSSVPIASRGKSVGATRVPVETRLVRPKRPPESYLGSSALRQARSHW